MATVTQDTKKWCVYLVWTNGTFEQTKVAQKALQDAGLECWTSPPTQPECNWMCPVASDTLDGAGIIKVLEAVEASLKETTLWWEGAYPEDNLEDSPYYPHKCAECGKPTHYQYKAIEFLHPTDDAKGVSIPDNNECDSTLVRVETTAPFVYLCFACLEGYVGDNEMTTGGTGLWMAI
jgi:hypothetical protein